MRADLRLLARERLGDETGRIDKAAPFTVALTYPSPYGAGMSSLGFQRIYRAIQETPGMAAERAFLDDDADGNILLQGEALTYESLRALTEFPVVATSVAYELEIAGLLRILEASGIPPERTLRSDQHPFVLGGGPLTFSNPLPLAPFVDALIMGEAEVLVIEVLKVIEGAASRREALDTLAGMPHVFVPSIHGSVLPSSAKVDNTVLPAWAPIRSPHMVLRDMFLIETERGCSRTCTYCVMRRSTNGGMRLASRERIMELIPPDAKRVGLVGAAVSDHPKIVSIVNELADSGREVGLSSLRPDRLSEEFVAALKRAGTKTLTTAMDGPSERMREKLERKAKVKHLERCADNARSQGMERMKLYLMIGLPGETSEDIDECVRFTTELSKRIPISLGIAPFCSKRNTPMDGEGFAGIDVVNDRLDQLRRGFRGRVDVRATSARWAWAEYVLAQGGEAEGLAVLEAMRAGGKFSHYKRAFDRVEKARPVGKIRRTLAIAPV